MSASSPKKTFTIASVAEAIDNAALCVGRLSAPPSHFPLPLTTWLVVVRSRRLRVFDWIILAGFRLLNILPLAKERFLAFADAFGLRHGNAPNSRDSIDYSSSV